MFSHIKNHFVAAFSYQSTTSILPALHSITQTRKRSKSSDEQEKKTEMRVQSPLLLLVLAAECRMYRYLSYDAITMKLKALENQYPDLVNLYNAQARRYSCP